MDAYQTADTGPAPPRRRLLAYLVLPGLFFLLGIAAMAWILSQWDYAARMIGVAPEPVAVKSSPPPAQRAEPKASEPEQQSGSSAPETIVIDPEIGRRVTELEERIAQI